MNLQRLMGTLSDWGCPGQSTTSLGSVTARGLVGKSTTTTTVWKEKETQPESSQYPAENAIAKLLLKPSKFTSKDFPFARRGGGCMRERMMLCLNGAISAREGGGERKTPPPPTPQPFQINRSGK